MSLFSKSLLTISLVIMNILCMINHSSSFYFNLSYKQKKCFYDEYYTDILVVLRSEVLNNFSWVTEETKQKKLEIEIIDEETNQIINKFQQTKVNEKFSYHLEVPTKVMVCLYSDYKAWFKDANGPLFITLQIDTNQDEVEEGALKNKDIIEFEKKIKIIKSQTNDIQHMQEFGMTKEEKFSQYQISNSNSIVNMTIIQIVIIIAIGIWQICFLKKHFETTSNERF